MRLNKTILYCDLVSGVQETDTGVQQEFDRCSRGKVAPAL
jgi:hypothetical protein